MITNTDAGFRSHPLRFLLEDAIRANTGGSTSARLCQAFDIKGWKHEFVQWDTKGRSVEQLTWNNDDVYRQLVAIYA